MSATIVNEGRSIDAWLFLEKEIEMHKLKRQEPNQKELFVNCFLIPQTKKDYQILSIKELPHVLPIPFALVASKTNGQTVKFFIEELGLHVNAICKNQDLRDLLPAKAIESEDLLHYFLQMSELSKDSFEERIQHIYISALKTKKTFSKKLKYAARIAAALFSRLSLNQTEHILKSIYEKVTISFGNIANFEANSVWLIPKDSSLKQLAPNISYEFLRDRLFQLMLSVISPEEIVKCQPEVLRKALEQEVFGEMKSLHVWMIPDIKTKITRALKNNFFDESYFCVCQLIPRTDEDLKILKDELKSTLLMPIGLFAHKREGDTCTLLVEGKNLEIQVTFSVNLQEENIPQSLLSESPNPHWFESNKSSEKNKDKFENWIDTLFCISLISNTTVEEKLRYLTRLASCEYMDQKTYHLSSHKFSKDEEVYLLLYFTEGVKSLSMSKFTMRRFNFSLMESLTNEEKKNKLVQKKIREYFLKA